MIIEFQAPGRPRIMIYSPSSLRLLFAWAVAHATICSFQITEYSHLPYASVDMQGCQIYINKTEHQKALNFK
jgi:hypothetical protein